ncbi:MAG: hypothetical protein HC866_16305 [Leptolyngbyaceae cyanobacterium RU_5_1]|nr:hypothetical protein [Leptolyngbyaceae cyanobacterium RU_5_1]
MLNLSLDPDDLPPAQLDQADSILCRQLEESISRHFYENCNGVTQALLLSCEWYIATNSDALMLVITCPDMMTNWRVLNNVVLIGNVLERFVSSAKIRVCPPADAGVPFEIRVDEISVYRDSL